jgi:hypothetical protein
MTVPAGGQTANDGSSVTATHGRFVLTITLMAADSEGFAVEVATIDTRCVEFPDPLALQESGGVALQGAGAP